MKISFRKDVAPLFWIALGALLAAFAVQCLLLPNNALDYGTAGLGIILSKVTGLNLSLCVFGIFAPFLIAGAIKFGTRFCIKTLVGSLVYTVGLELLTPVDLKIEHLLSVSFGGAVLGLGLAMILKNGGCIDGSEIFANIFLDEYNKRSKTRISNISGVLIMFNAGVYALAAITINLESAMLSLLTYFIASFIIDKETENFESIKKVTIVTDEYEQLVQNIKDKLNKTSTITKSFGVINGENNTVICYVNYFELETLKDIVEKSDTNAFVTVATVDEMYVNRKAGN